MLQGIRMNIDDIKPNQKKALFFAKKLLPELVYDAVQLEGINYTLPEIQTLLDGITVGGHKQSDQQITLNQANAWQFLFNSIENSDFNLSQIFACRLHRIAAIEESLTWGVFRIGSVSIAGSDYQPPAADLLDDCWEKMIVESKAISDNYDKAIYIFLQMARNQFFYDVNKRMGRFMMNGILLSAGYPAINVPVTRQQEFNELMLAFYPSNDGTAMNAFMRSCIPKAVLQAMIE